nr:MAG TPA: hypothetical protein [Microviridae sp.]
MYLSLNLGSPLRGGVDERGSPVATGDPLVLCFYLAVNNCEAWVWA